MSASETGLLFVWAELGPDVTEAEFNAWYDDEHIPARLGVPGFSTVARYKSVDGKTPTWLAIYNATSPEVFDSPAYKALGANPSPNDKSITSRLTAFSRRIFKLDATKENPTAPSPPSKFLYVASLDPKAENLEDFYHWHKDEHWGLVSKVPGFVRARQYSLVPGSAIELAGKADPNSPIGVFPHLNLVDWENNTFTSSPEFHAVTGSPWATKVLGDLSNQDHRLFTLHKSFSP